MTAVLDHDIDRRSHDRIEHSSEVEVVFEERVIDGLSKDLAAGGMCVVLGETSPVHVGDRVTVRFQLPRLPALTEAPAIVRWVGGPAQAALGLQFTEGLRAREVWAINQLKADEAYSG